ncbi:MAG: hypothetical protein ACFFD2_26065 [Promethearchaeota archaeon]
MRSRLKLEYYPKINEKLLNKSIELAANNKNKWDAPFFTDTETYINMEEINNASQDFLEKHIENIIVLGTGGSIQTLLALKHLSKKKIYPITSSRAVELNRCLKETNKDNSVVIPISRGGETLDVNSTIGTFQKHDYKFLGLSTQGTMNNILKNIGCPILDVPDLAGRFAGSISNVAIVPAYLSGINITDFLTGLKEGYEQYMTFRQNPAIEFASFLFNLYIMGYKVVFSMPYSENLEGSVGLFVQEISESTGKNNKGIMGVYQSAPICQHSVLEYLLGGTKGAVVPTIWIIEKEFDDPTLISSIDYVNGQTAQTIINYQADATFQALIEQGVPSAKIKINTPDAINIGVLISFIQSTVYFICLMFDVNWANNPKVVIGKKICNEALKNKIDPEEREKIRKLKADNIFKSFSFDHL